ncbi:MAG TPA: hypothetical protein V6D15_22850 [Oculatellaceae cyanobacterium]|jgi:hypothetical protein
MLAVASPSQTNIEPLVYEILAAGIITHTERLILKTVLLEKSLTEAEHIVIDRLLYGVKRGLLKTTD